MSVIRLIFFSICQHKICEVFLMFCLFLMDREQMVLYTIGKNLCYDAAV
jgi:hypothetical protein